uniref:Protein hook n=2 Tax=Parascaris univalens TaxID=6257 RepID=A0A915CDR9_PARUN
MEMDDEKYLDDLIRWLSALSVETPVNRETLYVGRCIAEALHQIDAVFFHEGWLEKVQAYDETANWRVKANNLRKIFRRITEFYKERLSKELGPEWIVDTSRIADENGEEVLSRLLQLVLGAALLSKSNKIFVPALLNQPESVQLCAMEIVQKLSNVAPTPGVIPEQNVEQASTDIESTKPTEEVAALNADIDNLHVERDRFMNEIKELREEIEQLSTENETLKQRVDGLLGNSTEMETLKKQLRLAQLSRETAQETLFKIEAERDHLKESYERSVEENAELKAKVDGIIPFEEEFRHMKDELEEYRLRSHEFEKMSAQIETYKAKLRQQKSQEAEMKVLNEKIAFYMQSVIALEDEQLKNEAIKTQMDVLRISNNDISNKLRTEIKRADKAEFELKRMRERAEDAEKELEHLRQEQKKLREALISKNEKMPVTRSESSLHDETIEIAGAPATLQERILKLEAENEHLRSSSAENEKIRLMKDEVENLKAQIAEMETEVRLCNLQNVELKANLKDAEERLTCGRTGEERRLAEQQEQNEKLRLLVAQMEVRLDESNNSNALLSNEKNKLAEELAAKDIELEAEKAKLINYMEKARRVINDLEEQSRAVESGALSRHEFDSIRKERDAYKQTIETMKQNMEQSQTLQEQEQQLITTHVYHMMMQLHQQAGWAGGDASSPKDGISTPERSFLTRQRQCGALNISSAMKLILTLFAALIASLLVSSDIY